MKKTNQQITDLKSNWFSDPCWDLENTEGFEDHREELLDFRLFHERKKKQSIIKDYKERISKKKKEIDILENTILFLEEEEYGNKDI